MSQSHPSPAFTTTHWSAVLNAGAGDSPAAKDALGELCATYWFPLYAHIRRRGHGAEDAADLTQEFFSVLIRRQSLAQVRPEKGRFRTYLLTSLDYFLHDQRARQQAAKRGGGATIIAIDALGAEHRFLLEAQTDETPDRAFDRSWAAALMDRAFTRLAAEQAELGKAALFARLRPFVTREVEAGEYDEVSAELGVPSNTIAKTVQRLRRRSRELLCEEAARTVAAEADVEQELRDLFR